MAPTEETRELLLSLERRLAEGAPMDAPEHDAVMTELFVQAHAELPPLAFHAWAACAFAARRGLVSEEQLEAMGADPYAVLFELERRGILAEFARAVQVPPQGGR